MKTAISIPDDIFEKAEHLSKRLKMSRSELYTNAVKGFIEQNKTKDITKLLNKVYEKNESGVDKILNKMQSSSMDKEKW